MKSRIDFQKIPQEAIKGMYQLEHFIHNSGLDEPLVPLLKMRASQINGCAYCLDMHSKDARALGETAPLLLIGMRAFVAAPPGGVTDPATVLPVQIFLWSDEVDRGFIEKTSAAIIVLLLFMLVMNGLAIYLRNRFERRW